MVIIAVFGGLILAGTVVAVLKNVGNSRERRNDKLNIL